ncbi:hypothetical protein BN2475_410015 [Paraburkholderia ribeironis]|uniref:Uncharacterized protein n=1 Tax=Paraburkholderia ribeironis TaxID=1247936 RepID=A0A1N7S770_9BURK|nr:hypothetical protein BN2475_410015 [Paraburkholderia ribeironis]
MTLIRNDDGRRELAASLMKALGNLENMSGSQHDFACHSVIRYVVILLATLRIAVTAVLLGITATLWLKLHGFAQGQCGSVLAGVTVRSRWHQAAWSRRSTAPPLSHEECLRNALPPADLETGLTGIAPST